MGSKVPPDPGDFEIGDDCYFCTVYPRPIFLPGRTPKYVKFEIFTDYELIDTQILTQHPVTVCSWNHTTPAGVTYNWWNLDLDYVYVRVYWYVVAVFHRSFYYYDHPACLTKIPNTIDPANPDYAGDTAKITWGEGIEP